MKRYHNLEKKSLILEYCRDKRVLDLGAGYGGDLAKYNEAKIKELFLVEPLEENILELKSRITNMNTNLKNITTLIYTKGENHEQILPILSKRVDVVSSFFSLTFLFESRQILGAFLDTVVKSLIEGGYFIGTMMSGEHTYNLLKDIPSNGKVNIGSSVVITKKYENGEPTTGQKVTVNILDSILHGDQIEYLAYFSILKEEMEKRKCRLITSFDFSNQESKLFNLSPDEIRFSKLNIGFVFQYMPHVVPYKIHRAPLNDTYEFTNLYEESQVLIRTGVPLLHSFYHSYLYNASSSYRQSDQERRNTMASDFHNKYGAMTLDTIPSFMNSQHVNIYILDSMKRRPIHIKGYKISREQSVIILYHDKNGFEPIAVNIHDIANRVFPPIDPFITNIHNHAKK